MPTEQTPPRYVLPPLKFGATKKEKNKRMVSWRLPGALSDKLDEVAREKGYTTTDMVTFVLDQYLQWNERKDNRGKALPAR